MITELGSNIGFDPEKIKRAREEELLDHLMWYQQEREEIMSSPELYENSRNKLLSITDSRLSTLLEQANGQIPSPEPRIRKDPLSPSKAREKDIKIHVTSIRIGIQRIRKNRYEEFSEKSKSTQLLKEQLKIDQVKKQIQSISLGTISVRRSPLGSWEARRKDLAMKIRAYGAARRRAISEGNDRDRDEFIFRIEELREILDKEYSIAETVS